MKKEKGITLGLRFTMIRVDFEIFVEYLSLWQGNLTRAGDQ